MFRSNLTVAAGTAASRVTGLIRVAVLGIVLGRTALSDAYNQANNTPNLVYELLLGGVLSAALVPLFTRLDHDKDEEGRAAVVSAATIVLVALTAVAVIAAPLVFRLYSLATSSAVPAGDYRAAGTLLARVFLVQILFYGLSSIWGSLLNARGRFFAAAWAPALSNMAIIVSLLLVPDIITGRAPVLTDVLSNARLRWTLGLGATAGIAVMALALIPALLSAGIPLRLRIDFKHPAVAQLRGLSGWLIGYVVANQIAILVIQNLLVHSGGGNQTAYTAAFTFFVLPHGLLAMSVATTFLPHMSAAIARGDRATLLARSTQGIRLIAMVTMPAGFGLFTLRRPIIGIALQHGKYTAADALITSRALAGFALGLVGFSVYLFVLRVFYAHQDARTPFVINVVENMVNIVLALVLVGRFAVLGLGLAFGIAYLVSSLWSLQIVSYKIADFPLRATLRSIVMMLIAATMMAEAVWLVARLVGSNDGVGAVVRVIVGTIIGIAVYGAVLRALGASEIDDLIARFRPASVPTSES
jgi:putative peptidoglycan lipid II flippase